MKYRKDKYGNDISVLGFGCMRFRRSGGSIDMDEAERELLRAIDAGVNYFDTAYIYPGSESALGEIFSKNQVREKVYIATKLPHYLIKSREGMERLFNEHLKRLKTDYIDYYLMHMLTDVQTWEKLKRMGILDFLEEKKRSGAIRQIGFSYHGNANMFCQLVDAYDWDFCQIQYNYMDTNEQAGDKGYALCEKLNVPIVIMEPVKGGALASYAPEVEAIFKAERPEKSIASWALRWVASKPQIKVVLSGMSNGEQLKDNLETFNNFEALSEKELETVNKAVEEIKSRIKNGCTGCRYCMPCPFGVNIPRNFSIWNNYGMYNNAGSAKWHYNSMKEEERADKCMSCGACEDACPQKLPIREQLAQVAELMQSLQ